MASGDYAAAAEIFERLAARAPIRGGRHIPILYLEAGRARILGGQVSEGLAHLKSGLDLLAERGRWARFQRAGQGALAELRQRGLRPETADPQAFLEGGLPAGFNLAMAPGLRQRPLLPTHCPSCGGPVEPDTVEWMDDATAECDYCGGPIRARE